MRAPFISMKRLFVFILGLSATAVWLSASWPGHRVQPSAGIRESVRSSGQTKSASMSGSESELTTSDETAHARVSEAYGKLPISFELNQGQFDSRVKFASRARGHELYLTPTEAVLTWSTPAARNKASRSIPREAAERQAVNDHRLNRFDRYARLESGNAHEAKFDSNQAVLRMKLVGSNRSARTEQIDELAGKSNYFIGNEPGNWRTGISNYSKVRFRAVYRGIDLVYYGDQRNLEYDFNVAPGANPEAIKFSFEGSKRARIDNNGDLVLTTFDGEDVRHRKPVAYQEKDGKRKLIAARYVMNRRGVVRFSVGPYDRNQPLVIDPVLVYSTLIGGSDYDQAFSIAVDSAGNAYITGTTSSLDFPLMNALQPLPRSIFIAKLNPSGSAIVYSTYFGGTHGTQSAYGLAIDTTGNVYVTGRTQDADFPAVNALQPHKWGRHRCFCDETQLDRISNNLFDLLRGRKRG